MSSLILASGSPRRREFLENLGLSFSVSPANIDESVPSTADPVFVATSLAEEKAQHVAASNPESVVLAADTIVAVAGGSNPILLEKPSSKDEAAAMLRQLSGKTHDVITGVCVARSDKSSSTAVRTLVTFCDLSDELIAWYVNSGEPFDKAGGYGIQGKAQAFIASISGSYSNVVGLPVVETLRLLEAFDIRVGKNSK